VLLVHPGRLGDGFFAEGASKWRGSYGEEVCVEKKGSSGKAWSATNDRAQRALKGSIAIVGGRGGKKPE